MEYARILLVLILVAISYATPGHRSVVDDILMESSGVLGQGETVRGRFRRQGANKDFDWFSQRGSPWCFCGSDNWLVQFVENNLVESTNCILDANSNFTTGQVGLGNKLSNNAKKSQCTYECVFRKSNLLNSDDNLDKTAIKDMFKNKVFVEEGLKQTADTVLDRCLSTGTVYTEALSMILSLARGTTCKQDPYKFVMCLLLEMAQNCPENLKKTEVSGCHKLYNNLEIASRRFYIHNYDDSGNKVM